MTAIYDCSVDSQLLTGMRLARGAIGRGELVVIPTDTVYGVAADAFDAAAVARLLEAKGRERTSPPPVLIPGIPTLDALASEVPEPVRQLVAEFWPGGLTVILHAQPSLQWDLGETRGTVALRMPANPIALELLSETGPLAVSSANLSGQPSATTAADAEEMLGELGHRLPRRRPGRRGLRGHRRAAGRHVVDHRRRHRARRRRGSAAHRARRRHLARAHRRGRRRGACWPRRRGRDHRPCRRSGVRRRAREPTDDARHRRRDAAVRRERGIRRARGIRRGRGLRRRRGTGDPAASDRDTADDGAGAAAS